MISLDNLICKAELQEESFKYFRGATPTQIKNIALALKESIAELNNVRNFSCELMEHCRSCSAHKSLLKIESLLKESE